MSAQIGYVGHHADHLVTPVEGNQALPGVGDPSTWAPKPTRRPLYGALPLVTTIATTAARSFFVIHAAFLNGYFWESFVAAAKPVEGGR